jgi:hypothetical protein
VDVVQDHDQRPIGGEALEQGADRAVGAVALVPGCGRAGNGLGAQGGKDAPELGSRLGGPAGHDVLVE